MRSNPSGVFSIPKNDFGSTDKIPNAVKNFIFVLKVKLNCRFDVRAAFKIGFSFIDNDDLMNALLTQRFSNDWENCFWRTVEFLEKKFGRIDANISKKFPNWQLSLSSNLNRLGSLRVNDRSNEKNPVNRQSNDLGSTQN